MLLSTEILKQIEKIVDRAYTDFTYLLLGEEALSDEQKVLVESLGLVIGRRPLIELLYLLARQRNTPNYKKDKTLMQLLSELSLSGVLPALTTARYTLEHTKAAVKEAIEDSKQEVKKQIKAEILKANNDFKEKESVKLDATISEQLDQRVEASNKLVSNLTKLATGTAIAYAFRKSFTSAMTNMINSTLVDMISERGPLSSDAAPGSILVYKEVVNDDRLSPECRRLHLHNDETPIIYSLSTLIQNGTNVGRPKSEWKAVVGGTHPNCRCTLRRK